MDMELVKDRGNKFLLSSIAVVVLLIIAFTQLTNTKNTRVKMTVSEIAGNEAAGGETAGVETVGVPDADDGITLFAGAAGALNAAPAELTKPAESTEPAQAAELTADAAVSSDEGTDTRDADAADESVSASEYAGEYADLAIAKVDNYVNVRSEPNTTSEIVGKMFDGSVAHVLSTAGENDEWLKMVSGKVEGYIKAEYFIYGDEAAEVAPNYVIQYAVVKADRLNVRKEPSTASDRIGYIDNGERVKLLEWGDEWSTVNYAGDHKGYVASQYITIDEEFIYAKSIEEEKAELAALLAQQERTRASEQAVPERAVISVAPPQTNYATVSELRMAIVNYAMQFLGNRYVMGGQSLVTGTDCSGFTCYIYKEFGYSLSRTPQGQYTAAGRTIDMSQIQPGDIVCYSSNGSTCTHVGLYIGDGQIIHAANSRKGVIISKVYYDNTFLCVKNVID